MVFEDFFTSIDNFRSLYILYLIIQIKNFSSSKIIVALFQMKLMRILLRRIIRHLLLLLSMIHLILVLMLIPFPIGVIRVLPSQMRRHSRLLRLVILVLLLHLHLVHHHLVDHLSQVVILVLLFLIKLMDLSLSY